MKKLNFGINVLSDRNSEEVFHNPNRYITELDIVRVRLVGDQALYALYNPIEQKVKDGVKVPFANRQVSELVKDLIRVDANKDLTRPGLFHSNDLVEMIDSESISSVELITLPYNDDVLVVAAPSDKIARSMSVKEFINTPESVIRSTYKAVFFTDEAAKQAKPKAQPTSYKIAYPFGYGVFFAPMESIRSRQLSNNQNSYTAILDWLDYAFAERAKKAQVKVYHAKLSDANWAEGGSRQDFEFVKDIQSFAKTSTSRFLTLNQKKGYHVMVIDVNPKHSNLDDKTFKSLIDGVYTNGIDAVIDGEKYHFRAALLSGSQARSMKIYFSTCPSESAFWEFRSELTFGLVQKGQIVVPASSEMRCGHGASSSQCVGKFSDITMTDDENVIKADVIKLQRVGKKYVPVVEANSVVPIKPSDGSGKYSFVVGAITSYRLGEMSLEELIILFKATTTMKARKEKFEGDLNFDVIDCDDLDTVRAKIKADKTGRLGRIFDKVCTGIQGRKGGGTKGLATIYDTKKYWNELMKKVNTNRANKKEGRIAVKFNPMLMFFSDSMRKLFNPDTIIYKDEFYVCQYVTAVNKKKGIERLSVQAFTSFELPRPVMDQLIKRELESYKKVLTNFEAAIKFIGATGFNVADTVLNKLFQMDQKLAKKAHRDPYVQDRLIKLINRQIDELQYGQFQVEAETHFITCDPFLASDRSKGLKAGQGFFRDQNGTRKGIIGLVRHPLYHRTERACIELVECEELWYLRNILVLNGCDATLIRMGGADVDGDKVMMIFDKLIMKSKDVAFYKPVIVQGLPGLTPQKKELTMEAIIDNMLAQANGTEIGLLTNIVLRLTDFRQALDLINKFPKFSKKEEREKLELSIIHLVCLSGAIIDQVKYAKDDHIKVEDYQEVYANYGYCSTVLNKYFNHKAGYEKNVNYQVLDLDTPMTYVYHQVNAWRDSNVLTANATGELAKHIEQSLPTREAFDIPYEIIVKARKYWRVAIGKVANLPQNSDEDKAIHKEAYNKVVNDVRDIILASHPDPRVAAALAYFSCYGNGRDLDITCRGMVWNCLADELIDYLSPGVSHFNVKAPTYADKHTHVEVFNGALFVNHIYDRRVGYQLASHELFELNGELYMDAITPRSILTQPATNRRIITASQFSLKCDIIITKGMVFAVKARGTGFGLYCKDETQRKDILVATLKIPSLFLDELRDTQIVVEEVAHYEQAKTYQLIVSVDKSLAPKVVTETIVEDSIDYADYMGEEELDVMPNDYFEFEALEEIDYHVGDQNYIDNVYAADLEKAYNEDREDEQILKGKLKATVVTLDEDSVYLEDDDDDFEFGVSDFDEFE